MKLLDTSVAIDHLRGVEADNALLQQLIDADELIVQYNLGYAKILPSP